MMDRFSKPSCVAIRIHLIIPTKSLLNAFSITLYFITAVYIFSYKTKRSLGHLCAVIVIISIKYKVIRPSSFAPSSATRVHPTTTCFTNILSKSQGLKNNKTTQNVFPGPNQTNTTGNCIHPEVCCRDGRKNGGRLGRGTGVNRSALQQGGRNSREGQ